MDFREIPEFMPFKIRTAKTMTLILIELCLYGASGGTAGAGFANTATEKDALLKRFRPDDGGILLLAWSGEYRTDIFYVTKEDLERHYK